MAEMVDRMISILTGVVVFAALVGATIALIFTNLGHVANNVTAQVGGLGALFGTAILGTIFVVYLFKNALGVFKGGR